MKKLFILFILFCAKSSFSQNPEKAVAAYKNQYYNVAISLWQDELKMPDANKALIYQNIGNTYFRMNDYGQAILNFEKSLRENYNQEDVKFNLMVARAKLKLDTENKILFTNDWMRKIAYVLPNFILKLVIIALSILMLLMAIYNYFKRISLLNKVHTGLLIFIGLLIGIFFLQSKFMAETGNAIIKYTCQGYETASLTGKPKNVVEGEKVEVLDEIGKAIQINSEADVKVWVDKGAVMAI